MEVINQQHVTATTCEVDHATSEDHKIPEQQQEIDAKIKVLSNINDCDADNASINSDDLQNTSEEKKDNYINKSKE